MKRNAKLIIFTGPSGVGKGTILKEFLSRANNIVYSISNTTRMPRAGELDGVNYFFISKNEFENLIKKDEFLEYAQYSGNYYGTSKKFVKAKLEENKSVILEIELQGALQVMKKFPDAISIFIMPPSFDELETRLRGRKSENEETIQKRLAIAKNELNNQDKFNYIVVNDKVENAVNKLLDICLKENIL